MRKFNKIMLYIAVAGLLFIIPAIYWSHASSNTKTNHEIKKATDKEMITENTELNNIEEPLKDNLNIESSLNAEAVLDITKIDKSLLKRIDYQSFVNGQTVNSYKREDRIVMGNSENYSKVKGITCFRGNNYRDSASYGFADLKEKKFKILWNIPIGSIDDWSGVG